MDKNLLPVEYILEIYESGQRGEPTYQYASSMPLSAMCIGDRFHNQSVPEWYSPPEFNEYFFVKDIMHFIFAIEGSHIFHKTMIELEKRPFNSAIQPN